MSNSNKKSNSRARQQSQRASKRKPQKSNNQQQARQFGLAGWTYLIVNGKEVIARGHIIYSPSPDNHFIQFGVAPDPVFFRFLSNKALQEGSLFPNEQEADKFLEAYFAQFNAPADDDDTCIDIDGKSYAITDDVRERADVNGRTIEQQVRYDIEADAEAAEDLADTGA